MDEFPTISIGNRKKFLDKARKKKETTMNIQANNQDIIKVQKNIRKYLTFVRLRESGMSLTEKILFAPKEQFFCNPDLIWQQMFDQKSPLIHRKMHLLGVAYLTQNFGSARKLGQKISESEQKIVQLLVNQIREASQIFGLLSKNEKIFYTKNILARSQEIQIPKLQYHHLQFVINFFLSNPSDYLLLFHESHQNRMFLRSLTQALCSHEPKTQQFFPVELQGQFSLENVYKNFLECFSEFPLHELQLKFPNLVLNCLNYLLSQLTEKGIRQIMRQYNIENFLLESEPETTIEVVKQKMEWLSFIDFLALTDNNKLLRSIINYFINCSSFEESLAFVHFINTVLQVIGSSHQDFNLNYDQFSILLKKMASWISVYQLEINMDHQRALLPMLTLIDMKLFSMDDKDFVSFFKNDTEFLEKIIKNHLIKIIYKVIFLKKPTKTIDKITIVAIRLLENLYNKIFRTQLITTEVFVNEILSSKLTLYRPGNALDEVTQFIQNFPFIFPLILRLQKFREFVHASRNQTMEEDDYYGGGGKVQIRRGRQFEDAFNQFKNRSLRNNIHVQFINELGIKQRGIDAGGLTKELINRVLKAIFKPEFGMFIENGEKELLPHPQRAQIEEGIIANHYHFIGRMIGKALFEGITIGPKFSGPFLNALIGKKNTFEDLQKIDKDLYKSLLYIKNMEEDALDLELTFQYKDQITKKFVNLKYNGHKIRVNNENKLEYISLLSHYKVNKLLEFQSRHIRKGLSSMINKEWLHMFNYEELNYLISGSGQINVEELKNYTIYGGYTEKDETIIHFWKVVKQMDQENRSNLLMFVTSCPRPSFLGFKDLNPKFTIIKAGSPDSLPVSHTCSNVLQLPDYRDEETIRKKLLMAINSNSGYQIA